MTYEACRAAFDASLKEPSRDPWSQLQDELYRWQVRSYGLPKAVELTLGVAEELGEFAEANFPLADYFDAIADTAIYAAQVATCFRLDLGQLAEAACAVCDGREQKTLVYQAKPFRWMATAGGRLAHVVLKAEQGIRGMGDKEAARRAAYDALVQVFAICVWCSPSCSAMALLENMAATAQKVMARDKAALPRVER